jgi:hypothetical protein
MSAPAQATNDPIRLTLSDLRRMNFDELSELYRHAKRPAALADLNGAARGAMLAWRSPSGGPLARILEAMGSSARFPWEGKTFQTETNDRGKGINRINLLRKMTWFPFATRFGPSFLDGQPAFVLDYSGQGNPPLINSIVDEVREVAPGLYMGPAALKVGGKPRPVLFFALSYQ